jgi:hypothetical protein
MNLFFFSFLNKIEKLFFKCDSLQILSEFFFKENVLGCNMMMTVFYS